MVDLPALPTPLRRYVERVVPNGSRGVERVHIAQVGQMWQKPGGRTLRFFATEELDVANVAFSWHARFPVAPLVSLRAVDEYRNGSGRFEVRVLGVPLARRRGHELDVAEAMRYLAELPWVPHAILANDRLRWRALDATTVEVTTNVAGTAASVRLRFDQEGLVTSSFSPARPRLEDGNRPTPWSGRFWSYATLGGVIVPTRAEVSWELPDGPFTYWSGSITALEAR